MVFDDESYELLFEIVHVFIVAYVFWCIISVL